MLIYKFGGSSIKDAEGIKNLTGIVSGVKESLVIIVSALGKTTNALEDLTKMAWEATADIEAGFLKIRNFHFGIAHELVPDSPDLEKRLDDDFRGLHTALNQRGGDFDEFYDQVVYWGEIFSTRIIHAVLKKSGIQNRWLDVSELIITDDNFRDARIHWEITTKNVKRDLNFKDCPVYLTQGFLGGTNKGYKTTLGREGSDFTAAVLGNILEAGSVIIWKDVPGILNADPQIFQDAVLLPEISYQEAIELAFFGAKVIHPKTIKPLQNKNIPLEVRSFKDPGQAGTLIRTDRLPDMKIPSYIIKKDQILLSVSPRDFSFAVDDCLGRIFSILNTFKIRVHLIQNSAISLSVCVDHAPMKLDGLLEQLNHEFLVFYNKDVTLITIRHYTPEAVQRAVYGKILIEQKTRNTVHFVVK